MSEIQVIQATLERTAARRRWQRGWRAFWHGLFAGTAFWLFILALYKLFPLPEETLTIAAAVSAALLPIGFLIGYWRRPALAETARGGGGRQHFQGRSSTALGAAAAAAAASRRLRVR